ncbi:MAG: AlpA family phage regulatory protein [Planctomycetes bacterium]|nr:AlpA family phage regulatory protein [Planctomycetota bacterium]
MDPNRPTFPDQILIPAEGVARILGCSRALVFRLEKLRLLPEPVRLTRRHLRWSRRELELWAQWGAPPRDEWETLRNRVRASELPIGNQTGGAP